MCVIFFFFFFFFFFFPFWFGGMLGGGLVGGFTIAVVERERVFGLGDLLGCVDALVVWLLLFAATGKVVE